MKLFSNECLKPNISNEDEDDNHIWCPIFPTRPQPTQRSKHSIDIHQRKLYMYGGRGKYGPLHDLWSFDLDAEAWTEISQQSTGISPGNLEGHSMVAYGHCLYVFGGKICSSADDISFWKFDIQECSWTHLLSEKNVFTPSSRREHTAVIFNHAMYVFGGFQEVLGPTSELWLYDFASKSWHLDSHASRTHPVARYDHSAVVHGERMWICGGLTGLLSTSEVWNWHFIDRVWTNIKFKSGPLELHGQSAVVIGWNMYIFGGTSKSGISKQELWKFSLWRQTWEKCTLSGVLKPEVISGHAMVTFVEFNNNKKRSTSVPILKSKVHMSSSHSLQLPRKNTVFPQSNDNEKLFYKRPHTSPAAYNSKDSSCLIPKDKLKKEDFCYEQPLEIIDLETTNNKSSMEYENSVLCKEDKNNISMHKNKLKLDKFIQSFETNSQMNLQAPVPLKNMGVKNNSHARQLTDLKGYSYNLSSGSSNTYKLNSREVETSFIELNVMTENKHRLITTDEIIVKPASYVTTDKNITNPVTDLSKYIIEKPELFEREKPNKFNMDFELSLLIVGGKTNDTLSSVSIDRPVKIWKCQNCKCDD